MNAFVLELEPPGVVTVIAFAPMLVLAGVTAVMDVTLTTVKLVTSIELIFTLVAPVKLVPKIVIAVPPVCGPELGVTEVIVGKETVYKNVTASLVDPPGVVTTTGFAPTVALAGVSPVILSAVTTTMLVTALPSIVTLEAPVKFFPKMEMAEPPAIVPFDGATDVITGAGVT